MSSEPECIVSTIEVANKIGNPALPAVEIVRSAVKLDDSEIRVVTCEKCGAGFAISTELGDDIAQLKLNTEPSVPGEACTTQYRKVGDWVTNLSKRWFKVYLLEPPGADSAEAAESSANVAFTVSPIGLEIALNDAAQNTATVHGAKKRKDPLEDASGIARLKSAATTAVNVLDLVLLRRDGKTWQEEVDERSAQIE